MPAPPVARPVATPLTDRLLEWNVAAYEAATVYLGDRLGLYQALDALGTASAKELAKAAGCDGRYTQEWLEQQAVAGILAVAHPSPQGAERRYAIPAEDRETLLDPDSLAHLAPLSRFTVGVYRGLPLLLEAFRTGQGVPYAAYGEDARVGQADVNRTMFVNLLGKDWLPALLDVHHRLQSDPPARVADVGCGLGWSSIAMAHAYPKTRIDGLDLDEPSIAQARANARAAGVQDRVRFQARDAADPALAGSYDLVTVFEALHDMARPVEALAAMRRMLAPGGSVLVADERCAEAFTAPGPLAERLFFGWSVLFCLPTSREQQPSAATGTAMRPATLAAYAKEAGFTRVEVAPIEHDLWRFYRLRP
jgi:2-polyprenyl-3-methyl-5-hydroxy-6-metoxy-1,4-benzoquinol methylase